MWPAIKALAPEDMDGCLSFASDSSKETGGSCLFFLFSFTVLDTALPPISKCEPSTAAAKWNEKESGVLLHQIVLTVPTTYNVGRVFVYARTLSQPASLEPN